MTTAVRLSTPRQASVDAILAVTSAELLTHGFRAASMDRIAAGARVSKATLYQHFASKTELLEASIEHALGRASRAARPPRALGDPEPTLARFAAWVRAISSAPEMLGLYRVSIELAVQMPSIANRIHARWRERDGALALYLNQLADAGLLRLPDRKVAQTQFGFLAIRALSDHVGAPRPPASDERRWNTGVASLFIAGHGRGVGEPVSPTMAPPAGNEDEDLYSRWRAGRMRLTRAQFDDLLDAAAEEFLARGFRDATLQPVATACRISRMTLRRQFGSKAELFDVAIRRYAARLYCRALPLDHAGGSFRQALERSARGLHERFRERDNVRLLRLLVAESPRFPELSASVYALSRGAELYRLDDWFRAAASRGALRREGIDDAAEHFHILAIQGNEALFAGVGGEDWPSCITSVESIVALFLEGYGASGTR